MAKILLISGMQRGIVSELPDNELPLRIEEIIPRYDRIAVSQFSNPGEDGGFVRFIGSYGMSGEDPEELEFAIKLPTRAKIMRVKRYGVSVSTLQRLGGQDGIDEVHLCGADIHTDIMMTAMGLFNVGIRPVVINDLCATRFGIVCHEAALTVLKRAIGDSQVVNSEDIFD